MSEVEKLLNLSFTRTSVEDPDSPDAKWCLQQYFADLRERFEGSFDARRSIPADPEANRSLHEAQALYRRNGYREVPAFNDEPYADHWFEKRNGPPGR